MDKKIVAEMDQKVTDQQNTLEKAGVPGFYITTNPQVTTPSGVGGGVGWDWVGEGPLTPLACFPQELTVQMNLLELILKLQQKESQPGVV